MTAAEFKEAQSQVRLTNEQTAALFRVSLRTVEKWRQGTRAVPGPVVVIFALLAHYKGAIRYILDRAT